MDFVSVLAGVVTLAAFPAIALIADRVLGSDGPPSFPAIFERPWEMGWPRGVQEEEPIRYHLEVIRHGGVHARTGRRMQPPMRTRIECEGCTPPLP